jgi:endoglucanase Acf2
LKNISKVLLSAILLYCSNFDLKAQTIKAGKGSYTKTFPGTDVAGRNGFPSGNPFTVGIASTKPAPTNDWWSAKIKNAHASNLFNYPYTLKTVNEGLIVTYIPWGVIDDIEPIKVGVQGLNASAANVSDFSDWTVSMDWKNGSSHFNATTGIGMPFLYFTKDSTNIAEITVASGSVRIAKEVLIITDARNGADFAVYAPKGSTWTENGKVYTSNLNGKNYWSMAFIPLDASDISKVVDEYKKFAFVFPANTLANWSYIDSTSVLKTDFNIQTEVKEGSDSLLLQGLLPHQWGHLAAGSAEPKGYSYKTVRGELKTLAGNSFSTENTFYGILPTLPYLDNYSPNFSTLEMSKKVKLLENDALNTWTDSYNEGQEMNRLIQTARIADLTKDTVALAKLVGTVKERLEDWLSADNNEVAFLFYYNQAWSSLIGYPAGHGQDGNLNDHHFHWGYFIHAASFMEQYEPGWAEKWGPMINLLIRDAASTNREDTEYPFLRNFSPYAGHCWANGFATFPQGNDQESTSESMQFNSALIHWGTITDNKDIRDLGIYLYTTEQAAIEEYWFDTKERNFLPSQQYSLVSRVWGNSYDNGTFWTNDIAASYGIELYPIHGGSFYLGQDTSYAKKLWNEIESNTGILNNEANDNLWHDIMWEYLAFTNPEKAIKLYESYPNRNLKFGVSDAQTYHWLHAMNVLGNIDVSVTANYPLAAVFSKNGTKTYVVQNYGKDSITVQFSDNYILKAKPNSISTSRDVAVTGSLKTDFKRAYPGNTIALDFTIVKGKPKKVVFYDGNSPIGEREQAPYSIKTAGLSAGKHYFYSKIYDSIGFNVSNICEVIVGDQIPYTGSPIKIPGSFEPGYYDKFIAGSAQDISYYDGSRGNAGDFRMDESVDVAMDVNEGAYVGWISPNEWLEYTIDVEKSGLYTLDLRYASGNAQGGGPFYFSLDEEPIGGTVRVNTTSGWEKWAVKSLSNIPLKKGIHTLRMDFDGGEFNLGKLTFSYNNVLPYSQPIADAGENTLIILPNATANLDASQSSDPSGLSLSYTWTQIYGPSKLAIQNRNSMTPLVTGLEEGVYLMQVQVNNGSRTDKDEMYLISNKDSNISPTVSICTPSNNSTLEEEETFKISAFANSIFDEITKVDFSIDGEIIGSTNELPYEIQWSLKPGDYVLTSKAYSKQGLSSESIGVNVTVTEAPPCKGLSNNGDFEYEFSPEDNNPTLTFIPTKAGTGSPTCILYYGTSSGALPGYGVQPNVPFRLINAPKGSKIYFYYTYSYPGQGEKNNANDKNSYTIGSCKSQSNAQVTIESPLMLYPNPVIDFIYLEFPKSISNAEIVNSTGRVLDRINTKFSNLKYDMSAFSSGVYFIKVKTLNGWKAYKLIKQ